MGAIPECPALGPGLVPRPEPRAAIVESVKNSLIVVAVVSTGLILTGCGASTAPEGDAVVSTSVPTKVAPTVVASQPYNAGGLLGGTAQPNFDDGESGVVSVVQIGPLDTSSGALLFAFRNNTSDGISHVDWTATARSGGSIVGAGSSQGTTPSQVQPGEVGLAYIYFDNSAAIPADAEYEFTVSTLPIDTSSYNTAPLKVTEANLVGDSIVGGAANGTGAETIGPYSVSVYCFDGDSLLSEFTTYAEQTGDVADGGSVTFSAPLYGETCPTFALGVSGYFS